MIVTGIKKLYKFLPPNPFSGLLLGIVTIVGGAVATIATPFIGAAIGAQMASENEKGGAKIAKSIGGGVGGFLLGVAATPVVATSSLLAGVTQPFLGLYKWINGKKIEQQQDQDFQNQVATISETTMSQLLGASQQNQ